MKLRILMRIAVIVSVLLLCTGFGVYSFYRLNSVDNRKDFNLYSLVPQDVTAVLETDRMADLVADINQLNCSKDKHFLYVSELFVYLKKYLYTLVENTPHGLSKQMNKMILSFHEPDTPMNQVLYCTLGSGDYELVESFVQKYCSSTFPSKFFDYKGAEIRIYPMPDGNFLAAYFTSYFLVVSFQKRLVEKVIDAYRAKKSLMQLPSFCAMLAGRSSNVAATVYLRMQAVDMGKQTDEMHSQTHLANWAEFDMKFSEDAIYCSGISHGVDSTKTFVNALRKQKPIEGFSGASLPASTFFYNYWAVSDQTTIFDFTAHQGYSKLACSDSIKKRDGELLAFLDKHGGESVMSCLFSSNDSIDKLPCAVVSIPIKNAFEAERHLQSLLYIVPKEEGVLFTHASPEFRRYPKARKFKQYVLPRNTLFTQITGITKQTLHTYACFYRGNLLLASEPRCLSAYIEAIENNSILDGIPIYEEGIASLSPIYNFLMMVDMEEMLNQPEAYLRLVPNLFIRQANFFRHFMFAVQFTCTDGIVYPNIVLLYKGNIEK